MKRSSVSILERASVLEGSEEVGLCKEISGAVVFSDCEFSESSSTLTLKLEGNDTTFEIRSCDYRGAIPVIKVDEKVVLHLHNNEVVAVEVLKDDNPDFVISRMLFIRSTGFHSGRPSYLSYSFRES